MAISIKNTLRRVSNSFKLSNKQNRIRNAGLGGGRGYPQTGTFGGYEELVPGGTQQIFPYEIDRITPEEFDLARKEYLQRGNQQTYNLQTIYREIVRDNHLHAAMELRNNLTLSKKFVCLLYTSPSPRDS